VRVNRGGRIISDLSEIGESKSPEEKRTSLGAFRTAKKISGLKVRDEEEKRRSKGLAPLSGLDIKPSEGGV